ncbi:hypothetical protein F2P79_024326 [Pimephales promelas]|nr:hypothetical protein F2P79_024326 [Pimephales promelas]
MPALISANAPQETDRRERKAQTGEDTDGEDTDGEDTDGGGSDGGGSDGGGSDGGGSDGGPTEREGTGERKRRPFKLAGSE